ncbi:MAG: molybdenum cofactor guanylyltransferase [Acidimicrobiia bacterium]|nr:molybdenum cofactor guanylyltransferase [Acidimicrobiia bacterium]
MTSVGAVVLAGGRSRRFGTDKATARVGGVSLLSRVLDVAAPLVDEVVVVGPWAPPGYARTLEPVRHEGPLAGLAWGLAAVGTGHALVLGCDHPLLDTGLLGHLLARRHEADAVVTRGPNGPEPLVGVYDTALAAVAEELTDSGERRLAALLDRCTVAWVEPEIWSTFDPEGRSFLDVDWPEDIDRIEALLPAEAEVPWDP